MSPQKHFLWFLCGFFFYSYCRFLFSTSILFCVFSINFLFAAVFFTLSAFDLSGLGKLCYNVVLLMQKLHKKYLKMIIEYSTNENQCCCHSLQKQTKHLSALYFCSNNKWQNTLRKCLWMKQLNMNSLSDHRLSTSVTHLVGNNRIQQTLKKHHNKLAFHVYLWLTCAFTSLLHHVSLSVMHLFLRPLHLRDTFCCQTDGKENKQTQKKWCQDLRVCLRAI